MNAEGLQACTEPAEPAPPHAANLNASAGVFIPTPCVAASLLRPAAVAARAASALQLTNPYRLGAPVNILQGQSHDLACTQPVLRVPAHDGHDSGMMADSIPAAWRTVFRHQAGHF